MFRAIGFLVVTVVLAGLGWLVYSQISKEAPQPLDPYRLEAARMVVGQISEGIPLEQGVRLVVFPDLSGTYSHEVSPMIRQALIDTGKYNVIDSGRLKEHLKEKKLDPKSAAAWAEVARALDAEGTLTGRIVSFPDPRGSNRTSLVLKLALHDKSGKQRFEKQYEAAISGGWFSLASWRAYLADSSGWKRFFAWFFVVLLLPVLAHPALRKLLQEESNLVNLYLLLGLTALGTLAAYVAIGLRVDGFWEGFGFLLALLICGFWNYVAATFVEVYLK